MGRDKVRYNMLSKTAFSDGLGVASADSASDAPTRIFISPKVDSAGWGPVYEAKQTVDGIYYANVYGISSATNGVSIRLYGSYSGADWYKIDDLILNATTGESVVKQATCNPAYLRVLYSSGFGRANMGVYFEAHELY